MPEPKPKRKDTPPEEEQLIGGGGDYEQYDDEGVPAGGLVSPAIARRPDQTRLARNDERADIMRRVLERLERQDEENAQIREALASLQDLAIGKEDYRKYADALDIAVDDLGLSDNSTQIRKKDPKQLEAITYAFNSQMSQLKRRRDALNDMMRDGQEDRYTVIREEVRQMFMEEGGGNEVIEFFLLQDNMDKKWASQEAMGDLSFKYLALLCWYADVPIPSEIRAEITRFAKTNRVSDDYLVDKTQ